MVVEDTIDQAATALIGELTTLLDIIDRNERAEHWTPREWACVDSGLDFVTYWDGNRQVPITNRTGMTRAGRAKFKPQLQRCSICLNASECYETAVETGETYGIWGGTFPHERKT